MTTQTQTRTTTLPKGLVELNEETGELMVDIVNPETGEVELVPAKSLEPNHLLYFLARSAKNINIEMEHAKNAADIQIERARGVLQNFKAQKENVLAMLNNMAAGVLEAEAANGKMPLDKKNRPYYSIPTIGKWGWRSQQQVLIDGGWDDLDEHDQADIVQVAPEGTFNTVVEHKPVKKEIRKAIKAGGVVRGWSLVDVKDKLSFIKEK